MRKFRPILIFGLIVALGVPSILATRTFEVHKKQDSLASVPIDELITRGCRSTQELREIKTSFEGTYHLKLRLADWAKRASKLSPGTLRRKLLTYSRDTSLDAAGMIFKMVAFDRGIHQTCQAKTVALSPDWVNQLTLARTSRKDRSE